MISLIFAIPGHAGAKKLPLFENAGACMGCHSSKGINKVFTDKDRISVFVSKNDFKNTVHGALNCTDCHPKVSLETHPDESLRVRAPF